MLSIIVPVCNEADNLTELHKRIIKSITPIGMELEIIMVDDGSQDHSLEVIKQLRAEDPHVKLIALSRNFGHQTALTAGLDYAMGDAIIMMDADLQHPPELIGEMIAQWKKGYDVVYTIRHYSSKINWLKRLTSRFYYALLKQVSKTPINPNAADFRLLSKRAANNLKKLRERHRFVRGMVSWIGFNQTSIHYNAEERKLGTSKYSFRKMADFAIIGLTSFTTVPLYISTIVGFIVSGFSFLYAIQVVYWKFHTDRAVQGWATIVILILFLGGIQLICLGIMGDYMGRMYDELKQRPLYLVKESLGFETGGSSGFSL